MLRLTQKLVLIALVALAIPAAAARAADVYYAQDDFNQPTGYFFQGNIGDTTFKYVPEGGYYEVNALKSKSGSLAALTDSFSAYEVSANLEFYEKNVRTDAYAGLIYHYQEDTAGKASFNIFAIFPDGYFCVWSVDKENQRRYAYKLTATPLVNPVGPNTLRVKVAANATDCYLNGMLVARFTDYTLDHGGVGVFASGGTRVRYRAFRWLVKEAEYEAQMAQSGAFGFIKEHKLPSAFTDSFTEKQWPEGESGKAVFSYGDSRYIVDNTRGDTMAVSYRVQPVVPAGMVTAVIASSEGEAGNGYGVAFCFNLEQAYASYYAFILARDGTYKVFKNEGGTATPLCEWKELPFPVDFSRPQLLGAAYIPSAQGMRIFLGLNGRALDQLIDTSPLAAGGFALIAAPKVRIEVSSISLVTFADKELEALAALTDALKKEK